MLLYIILTSFCKVAYPGLKFIFLCADWLFPLEWRKVAFLLGISASQVAFLFAILENNHRKDTFSHLTEKSANKWIYEYSVMSTRNAKKYAFVLIIFYTRSRFNKL